MTLKVTRVLLLDFEGMNFDLNVIKTWTKVVHKNQGYKDNYSI